MRPILLGFVYAFLAALGFSLVASVAICLGMDAETRKAADIASPLLGIFVGAWLASRDGSLRTGFFIGLIYVALWFGLWMYLMARWDPVAWMTLAVPRITLDHLTAWSVAILAGLFGVYLQRWRRSYFFAVLGIAALVWAADAALVMQQAGSVETDVSNYFHVERQVDPSDGTIAYALTIHFDRSESEMFVYDCDADYGQPKRFGDANTPFLGLDLATLVKRANSRSFDTGRRILCAINGGFFGASGWSVAHHEEPMNLGGEVHYNVDLLRPKDQAWFFAVNSWKNIRAGQPRFVMKPSIPWNEMANYETVLGGVRPLRVDGKSLPLAPGAGGTGLRCSRTSVGWSADGREFYILVVHDPDGELASQVQRRMHWTQTGGWDVPEVQRYWETKGVPFAILFDGGESTQLAFRTGEESYHYLDSGYQYSFTIGYLFRRPLVATFPILPASEAHRGVLNYLLISDQ